MELEGDHATLRAENARPRQENSALRAPFSLTWRNSGTAKTEEDGQFSKSTRYLAKEWWVWQILETSSTRSFDPKQPTQDI
jgi:hypothetical protein